MPLLIEKTDITSKNIDAIVNAANRALMGGGGVDGAIHRAAGPELLEACKKLKGFEPIGCDFGDAVLTPGFNLPARYIIHTVGPIWKGGEKLETKILAKCYQSCFKLLIKQGLKSIAFPAISTGVYGFPKNQAAHIAVAECFKFLEDKADIDIYLIAFDDETSSLYESEVQAHLNCTSILT